MGFVWDFAAVTLLNSVEPRLPVGKALPAAQRLSTRDEWWAHLLCALRVHPHRHTATIPQKKIEERPASRAFEALAYSGKAPEVAARYSASQLELQWWARHPLCRPGDEFGRFRWLLE